MLADCFGNPITTGNPDTVRAFDSYAGGFLSYGTTLPDVIAAADADPTCCTVNAHAAAVHLAFEAACGFERAAPYLARAQDAARGARPRERQFVDAVTAWAARDLPRCARLLSDHAAHWPDDITAIKWGQYHCFNLGDQDGLLALAEGLTESRDGEPFIHGMRAFALEQAHRLEEAEEEGRRAVEIERADPWAHHAVAHVMETQGRIADGLDWMLSLSDSWADKGHFIRLHNWWHVALFHMDNDDPAAALALYDRNLIDQYPEFCQEQIGAISALWRLELRGVDVGGRWAPVLARVRDRDLEHVLPFHDLHYIYALARAGSCCEVDTFLMSMERHAMAVPAPWDQVWKQVAVPVAHGLGAYGQGKHARAAELLAPRIDMLHLIGGSHAQRDIFVQTFIDALIRSGQIDAAEPLLRDRAEARPDVPEPQRQLAMIRKSA